MHFTSSSVSKTRQHIKICSQGRLPKCLRTTSEHSLHLAWLSKSGVCDYPDFKTLGDSPTAGQVVCCSKITLFKSIPLGFIPLQLPVASGNYKKFLPTLDSSVCKLHHTRKWSVSNTFLYDFQNCPNVSLSCIRF